MGPTQLLKVCCRVEPAPVICEWGGKAEGKENIVLPFRQGLRGEQLASFTHLLDLPILLVIVSLGALRPEG